MHPVEPSLRSTRQSYHCVRALGVCLTETSRRMDICPAFALPAAPKLALRHLHDAPRMTFLLEDGDEKAYEAALSFVDEYSFDETETEGLSLSVKDHTARSHYEVAPAPGALKDNIDSTETTASLGKNGLTTSTSQSEMPVKLLSSEDKRKRRVDINVRKKLLRRAGVYRDSNHARNQRTQELASLREQLEKLQIDLQTLKSKEALQLSKRTQQNGTTQQFANSLVTGGTQLCSIWEELAERQRCRREAAENDNVRLRLAVDRQQKIAESLRNLMQKRTSQLIAECYSLAIAESQIVHVLDFRGDIGEFQGLFRHLHAAYRELNAVFEANGLATMNITPSHVHMREGVDGKYMEFFTHKVLPFEMHDTTEVMWDHFKGVKKHIGHSSIYEKTAKDLDEPYTIVEDFTMAVHSNNARADVRVKQVVRRYVEKDRDIVIWVSSAVPIEVKHKILHGLAYHFRGYTVIKRSPASTADRELSELQLCSLISLDQDPETVYDSDTIRALTHFLIVHGAQGIRAHRELIENALVDRSLRHRLT